MLIAWVALNDFIFLSLSFQILSFWHWIHVFASWLLFYTYIICVWFVPYYHYKVIFIFKITSSTCSKMWTKLFFRSDEELRSVIIHSLLKYCLQILQSFEGWLTLGEGLNIVCLCFDNLKNESSCTYWVIKLLTLTLNVSLKCVEIANIPIFVMTTFLPSHSRNARYVKHMSRVGLVVYK